MTAQPKQKQKANVAVRLDEELEAYLRARAEEAHRTITGEIRLRLEQSWLADRQASKGHA